MSVMQHRLYFPFALLSARQIGLSFLTPGENRHGLLCSTVCVHLSSPHPSHVYTSVQQCVSQKMYKNTVPLLLTNSSDVSAF